MQEDMSLRRVFFLIDWIYSDMYNIYVCLCHLTAYVVLTGRFDPYIKAIYSVVRR